MFPVAAYRTVALFAVLALVQSGPAVCIHVHLQRGLPLERFIAHGATVHFHCRVRGHVSHHVRPFRESCVAHFAGEWFLIRVTPHVQCDLRFSREFHVTLRTWELLLANVLLILVLLHLSSICKPLQAHITCERLRLNIANRYVVLKNVSGDELPHALWTDDDLLVLLLIRLIGMDIGQMLS